MPRYIDADKMLKNYQEDICFSVECKLCPFLDGGECLCLVENFINEQPTADVVEVVRGEWADYKGDNNEWLRNDGKSVFCQCSKCEELYVRNFMYKFNYCPNCGADMRGDTE